MIIVNAACALYVADFVKTIPEGIPLARQAVASGAARRLLERVKELSHA